MYLYPLLMQKNLIWTWQMAQLTNVLHTLNSCTKIPRADLNLPKYFHSFGQILIDVNIENIRAIWSRCFRSNPGHSEKSCL